MFRNISRTVSRKSIGVELEKIIANLEVGKMRGRLQNIMGTVFGVC